MTEPSAFIGVMMAGMIPSVYGGAILKQAAPKLATRKGPVEVGADRDTVYTTRIQSRARWVSAGASLAGHPCRLSVNDPYYTLQYIPFIISIDIIVPCQISTPATVN